MTIKFVDGDILEVEAHIIAHQVNGLGIMETGLAGDIKEKYPETYEDYLGVINPLLPTANLGTIKLSETNDGKQICHMFSHNLAGIGRLTDYKALKACLIELKEYAKENDLTVVIPNKLGCGPDGGDWKRVTKIIKDAFKDYEITIVR